MTKWTKEQELAIEESGTNIIVSAGAGSGKTAVLTERVIRKLLNGEDINKLLILTFTNAAAKEMKDRIRDKIKEANLRDQLLKIDSSFITTFDSFALSIVKKYHYLLNIDNDIDISNNLVLKFKKEEILDKIFDNLYEKEDIKFLKFIKDFTMKDDTFLKESIMEISNKLDLKYDKEDYLNNYINNYYNDNYINLKIEKYNDLIFRKIDKIKENLNEISLIVDGDYFYELKLSVNNLINSTRYDEIKNNLAVNLPRLKKGMTDVKIYKDNINKYINELKKLTSYESISSIKESIINTKDYVEIIIKIIKELDKEFSEYKNKNKLYDFLDIAKFAIKIVSDYEEAREELKNSFNEILLDEYQDTSDLQEIFINLISNNNVYMVGDIKQSIYRFRNANPNLFKEKYLSYQEGINGIKIDLLNNFRSREEVLNNINNLFDDIMDLEIGGADYKESHRMIFGNNIYNSYKNNKQNYNYEIYNYNIENKEYSKDEIEAFITIKDIQDKINNHFQIYDKNINNLRDINYNDFVILMEKSTCFELYKKIFEYFGISLTIIKDEDISESYDLLIIKNILILLKKIKEKNYDKEFWYCYLSIGRSYLFSLSDDYLYQRITNKDVNNDIIIDSCNKILIEIDDLTLPDLINKIIINFSFYEKLITVGNIEESIIRLDYLEKLCFDLGALGYTYLDFIDYLKNLINKKEKIEYSLNKEINNSVKIMTIHKSKGLEYPICYYTGLNSKFNTMDMKKKFFFDEEFGIVTPYIDNGIRNTIYQTLYKEKYLKEDISEKIRLFYVALTRAKEKMILITNLKDEETSEEITLDTKLKYTSFSSVLNSLNTKLLPYIKNIDLLSLNLSKDYTMYKKYNILSKINKTNELIDVQELIIDNKSYEKHNYSKNNLLLINKEEKDKLDFGTKIHKIFEIVNFKTKNLKLIESEYHKYLEMFFKSELMKNIDNAKIYKEYEFIYKNKDKYLHGIIDLMLEYSNNIDIIDYKLNDINDLAYEKQLLGYKEYIKNKTKKEVNCYLYSIISGEIKKIE